MAVSEKLSAHIGKLQRAMCMIKEKTQCPICFSVMVSPVKGECEHTFCNECILKALENHRKCPLCQAKMTRRQLCPAPSFNEVFRSLPENFDEIDAVVRGIMGKSLGETFTGVLLTPKAREKKLDPGIAEALKRSIDMIERLGDPNLSATKKRKCSPPSGSLILARIETKKQPGIRTGDQPGRSTGKGFPAQSSVEPPPSVDHAGPSGVTDELTKSLDDTYEFVASQVASAGKLPGGRTHPESKEKRPRAGPSGSRTASKKSKPVPKHTAGDTVQSLTTKLVNKRVKKASPIDAVPVESISASSKAPVEFYAGSVESSLPQKDPSLKLTHRKKKDHVNRVEPKPYSALSSPCDHQQSKNQGTRGNRRNDLMALFANDDDDSGFKGDFFEPRLSPPKAVYSRRNIPRASLERRGGSTCSEPNLVALPSSSDSDPPQPTPLPVKKRLSRRTFDLDADTEAVEEIWRQSGKTQGAVSADREDVCLSTFPAIADEEVKPRSDDSIQEPFPDSQDNSSSSKEPPDVEMIVQLSPEVTAREEPPDVEMFAQPSSDVTAREAHSASESTVLRDNEFVKLTAPSCAMHDELSTSCSLPYDSNAGKLADEEIIEDGVISETDESEDEVQRAPQLEKPKDLPSGGGDSDSEESVIFGTPSSQQNRRERSVTPEEVGNHKENELPLLKPDGFRALLTSGLTPQENLLVQKFVKRFRVPYAKDFSGSVGNEVSHVIVHQSEDGGTPRTMKFLMGISRNCYVVTIGWIVKSLKDSVMADEDEFVADLGDMGPRRALEAKSKPLVGITIHVRSWDSALKLEEVETLSYNMGARVLGNILDHDGCGTLIVLVGEEYQDNSLAERLWGFGAVMVTTEWLIECVATYSCVSLYDYMSHPVLKLSIGSVPCVNPKLAELPDGVPRKAMRVTSFGASLTRL